MARETQKPKEDQVVVVRDQLIALDDWPQVLAAVRSGHITAWPIEEQVRLRDGLKAHYNGRFRTKDWNDQLRELKRSRRRSGGETYQMVLASEVEMRPIQWFWRNLIPYGALTGFDANGGEGKTSVSVYLIARNSRGELLPGDPVGTVRKPGWAFIFNDEDDPEDTIRPMLEAAGADTSRVHIFRVVDHADGSDRGFHINNPQDLAWLRARIREHKDDGPIVLMFDPLMEAIGGNVSTISDLDVRKALRALRRLVREEGVICLVLRHFSKGGGTKGAHRGLGSVGFTNTYRSLLIAAPHPDNPHDRKVLARSKNNNASEAQTPSLVYRLVTADWPDRPANMVDAKVRVVEWLLDEPCFYTADELLAADQARQHAVEQQFEDRYKEAPPVGEIRQEVRIDDVRAALQYMLGPHGNVLVLDDTKRPLTERRPGDATRPPLKPSELEQLGYERDEETGDYIARRECIGWYADPDGNNLLIGKDRLYDALAVRLSEQRFPLPFTRQSLSGYLHQNGLIETLTYGGKHIGQQLRYPGSGQRDRFILIVRARLSPGEGGSGDGDSGDSRDNKPTETEESSTGRAPADPGLDSLLLSPVTTVPAVTAPESL